MKHFFDVVPRHVLDFYLVVVGTHSGSDEFCAREAGGGEGQEISVGVTLDHVG